MSAITLDQACVIINPNAGDKKGLTDWPGIARLLDNAGIVYKHLFTESVGDAIRFTCKYAEKGFRHFIGVGGDGTFHEIVNGIATQSFVASNEIRLSMIPVGTGNDWCRMYDIPHDYSQAIELIKSGVTALQDVGRVTYQVSGQREERFFINIAGIGMDAKVVFDTNRRKERGSRGRAAYLMSLISATFSYRALPVKIMAGDEEIFSGPLYSGNIGICRFSGGGMQQLPYAVPDDGEFDVTIIRKVSKLKVLWNIRNLYDGSFVKLQEVSVNRGRSFTVISDAPIMLEADGEFLGSPPFEFNVLPAKLKITVKGDAWGFDLK